MRGPGQRPERDRRVKRPEGGRADCVRCGAARLGQQPDGVHIGQLALIGRHAVGGVALGQFHIAIAFLHGEPKIFRVHIILVVDKGFALDARNGPKRSRRWADHVAFDRPKLLGPGLKPRLSISAAAFVAPSLSDA
jgi:hypothetical protein